MTVRSGHAIDAPVATGSAHPIDPPVGLNQSWGRAFCVASGKVRPVVIDSSTTIASSGIASARNTPSFSGVMGPVGRCGSSRSTGFASAAFARAACGSESSTACSGRSARVVSGVRSMRCVPGASSRLRFVG